MVTFSNWLGVLAATAAYWVLGMIWYSPILFGKAWLRLTGLKPKPEDMRFAMVAGPILGLITSAGLMCFMSRLHIADVTSGVLLGLTVWFAFVFTTGAGSVVYEKYSTSLLWIHQGYYAVGYALIGAILSCFV